MTEPEVVDLSNLVPKKWKPVVGLIGSLLTFIVPVVLDVTADLPPVWTAIIAAVLAVLTALGIYKAPYVPANTIIASRTPEVVAAATHAQVTQEPVTPAPPVEEPGTPPANYKNPWK